MTCPECRQFYNAATESDSCPHPEVATNKLSDRELDVRIAVEVMGWHQATDYDYKPPQVNWVDAGGKYQAIVNCPEQLENILPWSFRPSIDISNAMLVVEKMREQGYGVGTTIFMLAHYGGEQVMVEMNVPSSECQEWGRTAAEAICKCALKAIDKFNLAALAATKESE